jgi:hypothetical protein
LSRNPGALTSRTYQGHVGLFRGYLTFLLISHFIWQIQGCWLFFSPTRKETSYSERFWCSYILFIIIIWWILLLFVYITRLASNEIFSPSNKWPRAVGRAKDLSAPLYNRTPKIRTSDEFVGNTIKLIFLEITGYRIKFRRVLWLLELQIGRGRKISRQVHTVNSGSRRGSQIRQGIPKVLFIGENWRHYPDSSLLLPKVYCLAHGSRGHWQLPLSRGGGCVDVEWWDVRVQNRAVQSCKFYVKTFLWDFRSGDGA